MVCLYGLSSKIIIEMPPDRAKKIHIQLTTRHLFFCSIRFFSFVLHERNLLKAYYYISDSVAVPYLYILLRQPKTSRTIKDIRGTYCTSYDDVLIISLPSSLYESDWNIHLLFGSLPNLNLILIFVLAVAPLLVTSPIVVCQKTRCYHQVHIIWNRQIEMEECYQK